MVDLSIIILSYNTKKLLEKCINSIFRNTKNISFEVIIVDNASTDGSKELIDMVSRKNNVSAILNNKNLGFAKANNQAIVKSKGRHILLLNSDTLLKNNVLGEMTKWMNNHPKVGILTCALKNKDGSLQGTGGYFPTLFRVFAWMFFLDDIPFIDRIIKPFHPMHGQSPFYKGEYFFKKEEQRDWITGAYFFIRSELTQEVGLLDEDYFMYTEEMDYCYRAKKLGWEVWYLPRWSIIHYGGASSTREYPILSEYKSIKLFYKKHMPKWQYPWLRMFLKGGAIARIIIFGIIKGKDVAKTYKKAFYQA